MAFTALPAAGAKLRGSVNSACFTEVRPIVAQKAATTSRNTTTSRTADPDLTIALPANSTWEVEIGMILSSAADAAGDFAYEISFPTGATVSGGGQGLDVALTTSVQAAMNAGTASTLDATTPTTAQAVGCSTSATFNRAIYRVVVTTAGSVALLWAQFGSNANNTNLLGGSWMTGRRVA